MLAVSEVYEQFLPLKKILPRKVGNAAAWEKFSKNNDENHAVIFCRVEHESTHTP